MEFNILNYEKFIRWTGISSAIFYILVINADDRFNLIKFLLGTLLYSSLLLKSFIWYKENEISKTRITLSSLTFIVILVLLFISLK